MRKKYEMIVKKLPWVDKVMDIDGNNTPYSLDYLMIRRIDNELLYTTPHVDDRKHENGELESLVSKTIFIVYGNNCIWHKVEKILYVYKVTE